MYQDNEGFRQLIARRMETFLRGVCHQQKIHLTFYCFPENTPEQDSDCAQELSVTPLCEIENPIKRLMPLAV